MKEKLSKTLSDFFQKNKDIPEETVEELQLVLNKVYDNASDEEDDLWNKGGDYYKATEALSKSSNSRLTLDGRSTPNYIIVCSYDQAETNAGKCPAKTSKLKNPAYLVKWCRFGNVTKYKWNEKKSIWNRQ